MDSSVQRERSRGADLPAQRRPPPFCSEIEQAFNTVIREAVAAASAPLTPDAPVTAPLRWTLKRLVAWIEARFQRVCSRETVRRALHRLKLSWKKARKLLGRADPDRREAFVEQIQTVLKGAAHDQHLLVYLDEAHIHQDADLGHGWSVRGERLWVCSSSPGLSAKVSFYGLYLYNLGETEIWPYPRANGDYTIEVLERLRQRFPTQPIKMVWDGASYHRAAKVRQRADELAIELMPLPAYSPDFMPVEALWRWLREEVTYHHCHATADELVTRVEQFRQQINAHPCQVADRLWVKDQLDPAEEKLRIPK